MNGPEHYEVAELLLARSDKALGEGVAEFYVAQAQVHATLALVAVTAEAAFDPDGRPLLAKSDATEQWAEVL